MLFDDDVMTNGQAKRSPFSSWLGCEEGIENLLLHLGWNAGAVVADPSMKRPLEKCSLGRLVHVRFGS